MSKAVPIVPQHQEYLDDHFGVAPDWKGFRRKLRSKSFAESVKQDPRSDRKLKRFAKMVGLRQSSKSKGVVVASDVSGTYRVRYHPQVNRMSCTCKDWTHVRSVKDRRIGDCKHIKRVKGATKEQLMRQKKASLGLNLFRLGRRVSKQDKDTDKATKARVKWKAYKEHFPTPSLMEQYLKKSANAEILGRVAKRILDRNLS